MKNYIIINQRAVMELNLGGIDVLEWLVYDYLKDYYFRAPKIVKNNKEYALLNYGDFRKYMPLLSVAEKQFYEIVVKLSENKLLEYFSMPGNRRYFRVIISI